MGKSIFKNKEVSDEFQTLLENKKVPLKKLWFRRKVLETIIHSTWKIQHKTGVKMLEVYNSYYHTNLKLEDVFNMNFIMNGGSGERNIEFVFSSKDTDKKFLFKFIDEVLGRVKTV